jgi:hypothetical protein
VSSHEKYLIIKIAVTLAVLSLFAAPAIGKLRDRLGRRGRAR